MKFFFKKTNYALDYRYIYFGLLDALTENTKRDDTSLSDIQQQSRQNFQKTRAINTLVRILLKKGKKKKYQLISYAALTKLVFVEKQRVSLPITSQNFFNYNIFADYSTLFTNFVKEKILIYRLDKNPKNLKQEIKYIKGDKRISFFLKKIFLGLNTFTQYSNIIGKLFGVLNLHNQTYHTTYTAVYKKIVYAQLLKSKKKLIN